ncbi:hypothetical protein N7462_007885 [Penicillium macrosclerotiorum]|uniref:uncharacterized protein n=1 Tax=Penicillium macrosclerotiorum TaxID=303699 RepID=UPI0025471CFC|nr:uncharacterized protein N7462_007885 [Penicillium macrosclerotiorum]KAJ5679641.1 hypothetical protein N7462_007885 [Penicillium macrosclerotiorum]
MSHYGNDGLSGSDDPNAMVSQPLREFENSNPQEALSSPPWSEYKPRPTLRPVIFDINHPSSFEIIVPKVKNPTDYEYLPGHFAVNRILRRIMDNPDKPSYTVLLKSGERETMSSDRLMRLENSTQALDEFNPVSDSDDDLLIVGRQPSSHRFSLGGDGVGSDYEIQFSGRRSIRPRRAATSGIYSSFYTIKNGEDESDDGENLSSADELNQRHPHKRRKPRQGPRRRTQKIPTDDDYSEPPRGQRISTREKKSLRKNLRERLEDDLSEAESDVPRQQKYAGAREVFREISRDDEFRQRHFASCSSCNFYEDDPERGLLVFCQGCSSSYHQACLGPRSSRDHLVTKIDDGDFILQCKRCLGIAHAKHDVAPHLGCCAICKEEGPMSQPLRERLSSKEEQQQRIENGGTDPVTSVDMARINNLDSILFRCTSCQRAFHIDHLPEAEGQDPVDVFEKYAVHWQCQDCSRALTEIEELVAWRPRNSDLKGSTIPPAEVIPETDKEYLIKWKTKSYFRCIWMPGDWVWGVCKAAMLRAFYASTKAKKPIWTTEEAIPEDNLRVDIVFSVRGSEDAENFENDEDLEGIEEAYVKYKGLNYEDSVWETPQIQLDAIRTLDFERDLALDMQPELVTGGDLMEYQLNGVSWLHYMFVRQQNAILADDMGLGKTIQVIALFATLIQKHHCWPFLVVAPNPTVPNWRREIKKWAPAIRVVTYYGTAFARNMAKEYEMFPEGTTKLRCHVVIASYESMVDEEAKRVLSRIRWGGLVVDEGQRLKNDRSQLYERLCQMKFDFKVLLTGTPLQNNIRELFNLIQFLDPEKDADQLEQQYGTLTTDNIKSLHEMIRPFFLRRTKAEVLPFLPPMVQIIIPVSMSVVQKKLYKSILGKNPQLIEAICKRQTGQLKKTERHNLNNILIQLRKCLCHPYIYNKNIEEQTHDHQLAFQQLVDASEKLRLLQLMLPKLCERGHRVLIFSQFLENLDIVEDFLSGIGLEYCRLDGRLTSRQKQHQIDEFNKPDSPFFVFLLSTRSGGVGINLASADTVIIMDPDFNPKQDMQALSRAHRIGQQNVVLVFHLTTKGSVEEKIMEKGKRKLALDHVLIERMEHDEDEEDLESILRHGAQALFDDDDSADVHYDSESIDKLLDRSQVEKKEQIEPQTSGPSDGQPRFSFARVWQTERGTLEEVTESEEATVDITFWEKILRERQRDAEEEAYRNAEGLGRGKRKRATVNYQTIREDDDVMDLDAPETSPVKARNTGDSDAEFQDYEGVDDMDSVVGDATMGAITISQAESKIQPFQRAIIPPLELPLTLDGTTDLPQCIACGQHHILGSCPLKQAGAEHCPLCGLAHFGKHRSCPHLQSEDQVRRMLEALGKSTENPKLVKLARKYIKGILGHLNSRDRKITGQMPTTQVSPGLLQDSALPASSTPVHQRRGDQSEPSYQNPSLSWQ